MSTVHIPAVSTNNIEDGTASKTDIADDINKNIQRQTQKPEKLFDVIGLSILGRVAFKNIINTQTSVKKKWNGHTALDGASATNLGIGGSVFVTAGAGESSDEGSESGDSEDGDFGEHG